MRKVRSRRGPFGRRCRVSLGLLAVALLGSLPGLAHLLGGSHAQRDVLHLTFLRAVERMRRVIHRRRVSLWPFAPLPIAALA